MPTRLHTRFFSRREFLRAVAVAAATIGGGAHVVPWLLRSKNPEAVHAAQGVQEPLPVGQTAAGDRYAGNWQTWVLRSGREISLPRPAAAGSSEQARELAQLRRAQLERTEEQLAAARLWDAGPATRRWTEIQLDMIKSHRPNPPRASRGLALMHIAMYDALIAAWHAKYLFNHLSPNTVDPTLMPAVRPRTTHLTHPSTPWPRGPLPGYFHTCSRSRGRNGSRRRRRRLRCRASGLAPTGPTPSSRASPLAVPWPRGSLRAPLQMVLALHGTGSA